MSFWIHLFSSVSTERNTENVFDERINKLQTVVDQLFKSAEDFQDVHRRITIGSLIGSVMGAVGGIAAIVGVVLAPFTLGTSLIGTCVGVVFGVKTGG